MRGTPAETFARSRLCAYEYHVMAFFVCFSVFPHTDLIRGPNHEWSFLSECGAQPVSANMLTPAAIVLFYETEYKLFSPFASSSSSSSSSFPSSPSASSFFQLSGRDAAWHSVTSHVFPNNQLPPSFTFDYGYAASDPHAPFRIVWKPGKGWGVFMTRRFQGRLTWYGMVSFQRHARLAATGDARVQMRQARGDYSHRATARSDVDHCGL